MKKLLLIGSLFFIGCTGTTLDPIENSNKRKYDIRDVGVIKDVNVIPTSSNERIKTQIKTDKDFLVIYYIPQLKFGNQLKGIYYNEKLIGIIDKNGDEFDIADGKR